jgi:hypothetical protein
MNTELRFFQNYLSHICGKTKGGKNDKNSSNGVDI